MTNLFCLFGHKWSALKAERENTIKYVTLVCKKCQKLFSAMQDAGFEMHIMDHFNTWYEIGDAIKPVNDRMSEYLDNAWSIKKMTNSITIRTNEENR